MHSRGLLLTAPCLSPCPPSFHQAVIARDFSFMTQSFGMTSAAFTILFMRIKLDWYSIVYTTLGGIPGLIFGLEYVFPAMPSPYPKVMGRPRVWVLLAEGHGRSTAGRRLSPD